MFHLFRIAVIFLLLTGLSVQGAWAAAFQCAQGQELQQVVQKEPPADHAAMLLEHDGGAQFDAQDCEKFWTSACTAMALLPAQPSVAAVHGAFGLVPPSASVPVLFFTDGPDRPPRLHSS
ncbi:hypothetical protein [Piscinibacter koreensis]|uniref:Uncharacterized protein n=1 Tax=Piscinibacter koreensis TaxID=2742824 RepID=A0A7Y6TYN4_9BURK|nr:hypothetical protein [Schlegelella koreensis]NUZ08433.1 hypothetical protein [Schlegelella koreensis]